MIINKSKWILLIFVTLSIFMSCTAKANEVKNKSFASSITDKLKVPRVLLIGDSISIGYTLPVQEALAMKAVVHRPATNCQDTGKGLKYIDDWLGNVHWDVIHFNFGIHDIKIVRGVNNVPTEQYRKNLIAIVSKLKKTGAKLIWASTTPTPHRPIEDYIKYNLVAKEIMQKNNISINDLYEFVLPRLSKIQIPSDSHFTQEGSKLIGEKVTLEITNVSDLINQSFWSKWRLEILITCIGGIILFFIWFYRVKKKF